MDNEIVYWSLEQIRSRVGTEENLFSPERRKFLNDKLEEYDSGGRKAHEIASEYREEI